MNSAVLRQVGRLEPCPPIRSNCPSRIPALSVRAMRPPISRSESTTVITWDQLTPTSSMITHQVARMQPTTQSSGLPHQQSFPC